jgi:hypothetical protein
LKPTPSFSRNRAFILNFPSLPRTPDPADSPSCQLSPSQIGRHFRNLVADSTSYRPDPNSPLFFAIFKV